MVSVRKLDMGRLLVFSIVIGLFPVLLQGQAVDTRTRVFDNTFKSLRVALEGNYYAPPVITLGGQERIRVEFDEISPERTYLRYALVHCNADWQPSQLIETEYVDGFNEADVEEYAYSSATFANYVHYGITIPNDDMRMLVSGNYLLKVYDESDSERIFLQARFCVNENNVNLAAEVTSRTDVDYNAGHQQLSVTVDAHDYRIENLYDDLKVSVSQNSRTDNAVVVSRPLRVSGSKAFFEHDRNLIFPAGNEFRRFEMTTTNYLGMGVESYSYHHPYYHATLQTDRPRAGVSYAYDRTQYGRFTIRESNASDSDTEADYMAVHFSLKMPERTGGAIYVDGEFTQHIFAGTNKMRYNYDSGCYEADIVLKQGAYNYQYLWIPDGSMVGQTSVVEGDFYQTVNEYQILVYTRKQGERYDRLIGYGVLFSGK